MRRILIIGAIVGLALGLLLTTGGYLYIHSSHFQRYMEKRVVQFLQDRYEVRVELDGIEFKLLGTRLELHKLRIFDRSFPSQDPAIEAGRIVVDFSVTSLLSPAFSLDQLLLESLSVRIIEDPNDRLNLANMFFSRPAQPPNPDQKGKLAGFLKLAVKELAVREGLILYKDQPFNIQSVEGGLKVEMDYDAQTQSYRGRAEVRQDKLDVSAFQIEQTQTSILFELYDDRINLPSVTIQSPAVTGSVSGEFSSLSELSYRFETQLSIDPAQLSEPPIGRFLSGGSLNVSGVFSGGGSGFQFEGQVQSPKIYFKTLPLENLQAGVRVDRESTLVTSLSTRLYSGQIAAMGELFWGESSRTHFEVEGTGVRLQPLLNVFDLDPLQITGRTDFRAKLGWPGLRIAELKGTGRADYHGDFQIRTQEPGTAYSYEGGAAVELDARGVRFQDGMLTTLQSDIAFSGLFSYEADYEIDFDLSSGPQNRLLEMAFETGLIPTQMLSESDVTIGGDVQIDGHISGQGKAFELDGRARVAGVAVKKEPLGTVSASIVLNAEGIKLQDIRLAGSDFEITGTLTSALHTAPEEKRLKNLELSLREVPVSVILGLTERELPADGRLSGKVSLSQLENGYRGSGHITLLGPRFYGEALDKMEADLEFDGPEVRVQNMQARIETGTIQGSLRLNTSTKQFQLHVDGSRVPLQKIDLLYQRFPVEALADFAMDASGSPQAPDVQITLNAPTARIGDQVFEGLALRAKNKPEDNTRASFQLRTAYLGQSFDVAGELGLRDPFPVQAAVELRQISLSPYLQLLPFDNTPKLEGMVTGRLELKGLLSDLANLHAEGRFSRLTLHAADYEVTNSNPVQLTYDAGVLTIEPLTLTGKETELSVKGTLQLSPEKVIHLETDGSLNLLLLNTFVTGGTTFGQLNLETVISGPLENPRIVGKARLSDGFLRHPDIPTTIFEAQGDFRFTANQVSIDQLSARTIYGTVNVEGGVFLEKLQPQRWHLNIFGSGLRLEYPSEVFSTLDVDLDLIRSDVSQLLSGVVYVRAADYTRELSVPELILEYGGSPTIPTTTARQELVLDIDVEGYQTLRLNNNLADLVASGDFRLRGTLQNPVILGSLNVEEGKLFLENNEYDITRGTVSFNNPRRTRPVFSFEAETEVRDTSVKVLLNGPLDQLKVNFRSDPPLSTSSIVSLLAVGQTQEEIFGVEGGGQSQFGSLAIYGAGALLSKSLGEKLEAQTSRLFGFDRLSIDPFLSASERDPGARVTLGKQLGRNVSVTYSTDLGNEGQGQIVVIEVKLTDWLTAVGTGEQNGAIAIDFKLKKRF